LADFCEPDVRVGADFFLVVTGIETGS